MSFIVTWPETVEHFTLSLQVASKLRITLSWKQPLPTGAYSYDSQWDECTETRTNPRRTKSDRNLEFPA